MVDDVGDCLYKVSGWWVRSENAYIRSVDAFLRSLDGR